MLSLLKSRFLWFTSIALSIFNFFKIFSNHICILNTIRKKKKILKLFSSLCNFCHQAAQEGSWKHEAYLLFPVHLDGTLLDNAQSMKAKKEFFSTTDVLHIFRQVHGCVSIANLIWVMVLSAIRPRIDDIIIHVDKLISKFSHWYRYSMKWSAIQYVTGDLFTFSSKQGYQKAVILHFFCTLKWNRKRSK